MPVQILQPVVHAFRANLLPALILWAAGALMVGCYYQIGWVRAQFDGVWTFRSSVGLIFPILSTALAGAIIPTLLQLWMKPAIRRETLRLLPWLTLLWAWKGIEVDLFYRLQAWLFGTTTAPGVIVGKVIVDMFVYNPLLGALFPAIYYRWIQRPSRAVELFPKNWYRKLVMPLLVVTWAIWIPAVALIYMMPTPLQLPLQNLVLVFFSLLVLIVTKPESEQVAAPLQ